MIELSLGVLAVASTVWVVVGVPALLHMRRTAREVQRTAQDAQSMIHVLRQEVIPLVREMRSTAQHVDDMALHLSAGIEQLHQAAAQVGRTGRALLNLPGGQPWNRIIWKSMIVGVGIRAVASTIRKWKQRAPIPQQEVRNGR